MNIKVEINYAAKIWTAFDVTYFFINQIITSIPDQKIESYSSTYSVSASETEREATATPASGSSGAYHVCKSIILVGMLGRNMGVFLAQTINTLKTASKEDIGHNYDDQRINTKLNFVDYDIVMSH